MNLLKIVKTGGLERPVYNLSLGDCLLYESVLPSVRSESQSTILVCRECLPYESMLSSVMECRDMCITKVSLQS